MNTVIQKFGGTSMGTIESITQSAKIASNCAKENRTVVVVSALSGTTDGLLELVDLAHRQKPKLIASRLNAMEDRHLEVLSAFVEKDRLSDVWDDEFAPAFKRLRTILTGISYVGDVSEKSMAIVTSYGERLSSRIMRNAIEAQGCTSERINSTRLVRTDSHYMEAEVDFQRSRVCCKRLLPPLLKKGVTPVVTGFFGKDTHGDITLLGRGGSDYTASIMAICLDADRVEIWTDVDGVMSADPRKVENVVTWGTVDMAVMSELSHGGAKVLHPKTISAAIEKGIPVWVKNTFNPSARGTEIIAKQKKQEVKGIAVDKGQLLFHIEEPGMLSGLGFLRKVSQVFEEQRVAIDIMATSEVTVSVSIDQKSYSKSLLKELRKIADTEVIDHLAKICIIGNNIGHDAELLHRIFSTLKDEKIYTISNGASFNNITLLVNEKHADAILKNLHAVLF